MKALIKILVVVLVIWWLYEWILDTPEAKTDQASIVQVQIGKLLAKPNAYNDVVEINGEVSQSLNLLGVKCYKVQDSTGTITIIPSDEIEAVPKEGNQVQVKGELNQIVKTGQKQIIVLNQIANEPEKEAEEIDSTGQE